MSKDKLSKSKTDQKEAEIFHRNIHDDYDLIVKSLDCMEDSYFSIVDATGRIVYLSTDFEKIDGYKVSDILGENVLDVYKTDLNSSTHMKTINDKTVLKNAHFYYPSVTGQPVEVVMDVYPVFSGAKVIGSFGVTRDTSKIQALTEKLFILQKALVDQTRRINKNGTQFCFDDIIGSGQEMQNVIKTAKKMANSESRIMILGETGTGKELFAQSIHNASARAKEPFIAINCSAIPDTLLESILFGTTKGAFTGAEDKPGLFEEAKNGTLFLDELNSMNIVLQSKLLRALETNTIRRVGGNKEIPANPRIISAMNVDPEEAIKAGNMRSDFFYRLAVVIIECPPLRNNEENIIELARFFINRYNKILGRNIDEISEEVIQILKSYKWPGNVRELSHCIEYAMNMVDIEDNCLSVKHLPAFVLENTATNVILPVIVPEITDYNQTIMQIERNILTQALKDNNGNINKTAKELNLSRQNLFYKLKRLNIEIEHEIHIE